MVALLLPSNRTWLEVVAAGAVVFLSSPGSGVVDEDPEFDEEPELLESSGFVTLDGPEFEEEPLLEEDPEFEEPEFEEPELDEPELEDPLLPPLCPSSL
jgi:hypothetical protein